MSQLDTCSTLNSDNIKELEQATYRVNSNNSGNPLTVSYCRGYWAKIGQKYPFGVA